MSSNLPDSRGPTVPECRLLAIDALCDRFEAAWRAGEGPAIEDFLVLGPPGCEDDLFRYLLAVELGGTLLLVATVGAIAIAGRRGERRA